MLNLELRIPPLVLTVMFTVAGFAGARLLPGWTFYIPGSGSLAIVLGSVGLVIVGLGVFEFRRSKTTVNPTCPENTTSVVSNGVYRYTRNPMYLGFALWLASTAVWVSHPLAFFIVLIFIVYIDRMQILPEERMLLTKFGTNYLTYQQQVRRWL